MLTEMQYIRETLPQEELLCGLAEEAAELAQAALKLRRVYDGSNPTPINRSDALRHLLEELADVSLYVIALNYDYLYLSEIQDNANVKVERWAERLREREG